MDVTRGPCVVSLIAAAECGTPVTGTKARILGLLASRGIPVPDGVVLTADPGQYPVRAPDQVVAQDAARAAVRRIVANLGDVPLAVRRSPAASKIPAPDPPRTGNRAILGIRGSRALHDAIRRTWHATVPVLVQRFVAAECAGVVRPAGGAGGGLLVLALPGGVPAGESGARPADCWSVRDGVTLPRSVTRQALTRNQVHSIAALALRVFAVTGGHREVEWVMAERRFWVMHSRPVAPRVAGAVDSSGSAAADELFD